MARSNKDDGRWWAEHVIPPLLAALATGMFGYWVAHENNKANYEQLNRTAQQEYAVGRRKVAETVAENFEAYVANWGRLRALAKTVVDGAEDAPQQEKKVLEVAEKRNASRDALFGALARAQLYFGDQTCTLITTFKAWDTDYSVTPIAELPPQKSWAEHRDKIVNAMKAELGGITSK
jgi:hypothetical protein